MIRKRLIRALEGHRDQGDRGIKVDVPDFHGRLHPEDFLDWAWRSSLIGKNYPRCAKVKFLSTGHASIWWDQVQARRKRKGKGKYMGQDAIEVAGEISTLRLDPKLVPKVPLRFKG